MIGGCMVVGYYVIRDIGMGLGNALKGISLSLDVHQNPSLYGMDMAFSPHGSKAYVTVPSRDLLEVFDVHTGTILARISTGQTPTGLAVNPDGSQVWVVDTSVRSILDSVNSSSDKANGSVSVISTRTSKVIRTIPVGIGPIDVAFSPSGATAYVTVNGVVGSGYVSVIDTSTFRTIANIVPSLASLASAPTATASATSLTMRTTGALCPSGVPDYCWYPTSVAVTPGGKEVWVSEASTVAGHSSIAASLPGVVPYPDYVYVFSTTSYKQLASIRVGNGPYFMTMSRDGSYVYVAAKAGCEMDQISTATLAVVATVQTPASYGCPFGVAAGTSNSIAYSVTGNDRTVDVGSEGDVLEVVNFATGLVNVHGGVGTDPVTVSVSPSNGLIYVVDAKSPAIVGLSPVSYAPVSILHVSIQRAATIHGSSDKSSAIRKR
ncbi:MAG: YncE family protein [Actinobacteria bacterium]|nr:YncE family protein [Actinomycetota bacterium]